MSFQNARIAGVGIDAAVHHTQTVPRGDKSFRVSPSSLKEFGRCPSRWVKGYNSPESKAKDWGNLIDTLMLTPEKFSERYVVRPEVLTDTVLKCPKCGSVTDARKCRACGVDRVLTAVDVPYSANSTVWRDFYADAVVKDVEVISRERMTEADKACGELLADETVRAFIDASEKQVQVVADWRDDDTGIIVPAQCLIDLAPRNDTEFMKCLGDLKTVKNAAVIPFGRQVFDYGWHVQAAFDLDLYVAATGEDRNTWCLICQENYEPWQVGKRILSQDYLELGRAEYQRLLRLYARCLASGKWPGYDDNDEAAQGWTITSPIPFMGSKDLFAPKFIAQGEAFEPIAETGEAMP